MLGCANSWDDEEGENMRMIETMGIMRTVRVMRRIRRV